MKRFYDEASVQEAEDGWQVTLDGRGLKTVKGTPQILPSVPLAQALAAEWAGQGENIDPTSFPMRDMADYAIDMIAPAPQAVIEKLGEYGDTDTLLYRADPDEPLYARQQDIWEPIVSALELSEGITFKRVSGIMHAAQDAGTIATLRAHLITLSPFALAGVETMTSLAASLIIGISAIREGADAKALWDAASLEEEWQAQQWGRDEEAEERRARRTADFLRACEFVRLAGGSQQI